MKIFLTGCTSPQASKTHSENFPSFAGIIYTAFIELGYEVTWSNPSVDMTREYLSQFDAVVVGMASPLGLTSHRLYGALAVINEAIEIGNLSLFIDSPEPHKVWNGIRGVYKQPLSLIKDFYSKRQEYDKVLEKENFEKIYSAISKLYTGIWPRTIVPGHSWTKAGSVTKHIPNIDPTNIFAICPDSLILNTKRHGTKSLEEKYWCVDDAGTDWSKKIEKNLSYQMQPYRQGRFEGSQEIATRLDKSVGLLVSTYKNNDSWWTPSLSQGLHVGTPVVTDWRHSQLLGEEWSKLPSQIEEMSPQERISLAKNQKEIYKLSIPSWQSFKDSISTLVLHNIYSNN